MGSNQYNEQAQALPPSVSPDSPLTVPEPHIDAVAARAQQNHQTDNEMQPEQKPNADLEGSTTSVLPLAAPEDLKEDVKTESKPSSLDVSDDPWDDVRSSVRLAAKKEELVDSTLPAQVSSETPKAEVKEEEKPRLTETDDPWEDIGVGVRSTAKKEPFESSLSSSSSAASSSPMLCGLKRSRSDSSLSSIPSDFELGLEKHTERSNINKRIRGPQTVSFTRRLEPVSFASAGGPQLGNQRPLGEAGHLQALRSVTFRVVTDDSGIDIDIPVSDPAPPFPDNEPFFPPIDDQVAPPRSPTPIHNISKPASHAPFKAAVRVKDEPIDVDDDVILNAINRNSVATNVQLKAKKEFEFDEMTMHKRFTRVGATAPYKIEGVPEPLLNILFSRKCMSWYYGGNPQELYPTVSKAKFDLPGRGVDNFAFIPLHLHPNAPKRPGDHGAMHQGVIGTYRQPDDFRPDFLKDYKPLILKVEHEKKPVVHGEARSVESKEMTMLVGGAQGGFMGTDSRYWQYVGQYVQIVVDSLTTQEWLLQDGKVHTAWARELAKACTGWGSHVCFRAVYRRRYHRDPTEEEEDSWWRLVQRGDIKFDEWKVQPQWIKEDFNAGKEHLTVEVLKCVGYDTSFVRRSAVVMEGYVKNPPARPTKAKKAKVGKERRTPPSAMEKNKAKAAAQKNQTKVARKKNGKRRAVSQSPVRSDLESAVDDDEDVAEEDDDAPDQGQYQPKPSKSRSKPIEVIELD